MVANVYRGRIYIRNVATLESKVCNKTANIIITLCINATNLS